MNTSDHIAAELRGIYRLLVAGAVCVLVIAAGHLLAVLQTARFESDPPIDKPFEDRAIKLKGDEKWDELLQACLDRQLVHPTDVRAFYYGGIAHMNRGEYDKAIAALKRAAQLQPGWKKSAQEMIDATEWRRKQGQPQNSNAATAPTKVVPTKVVPANVAAPNAAPTRAAPR